MITLNGSTESITAVLSGSVSCDFHVRADLQTSPGTASPYQNTFNYATGTTPVVACAAPADGVFATVQLITVRNVGSTNVSVTFKKKVVSTTYSLSPALSLNAGDAAVFTPLEGWRVFDSNGALKTNGVVVGPQSTVRFPVAGRTAGIASTRQLPGTSAATSVFAYYLGKASVAVTSVVVKANVTIAATATIAALEVAIATGAPGAFSGLTSTLTVKGFADVSATYNGTGLISTTVTLSAGQSINVGDDVWVLFCSATSGTAPTISAFDAGDVLRSNLTGVITGALTAIRPSTVLLGVATAFTTEAAAVLPPWVGVTGI